MRGAPKRLKIFLAFFGIIVASYLFIQFASSFGGEIPPEFSEARLQGALIAQQIVIFSNQSLEDLRTINKLHQEQNFSDAIKLITKVIDRTTDVRSQAVSLSVELEKMTRALSAIDSFEARQLSLEAISSRLAIINRLINYSSYLAQLMDLLRNRFSGSQIGEGQVGLLIDQINIEIKSINELNAQAGKTMERFDEITSK